MRCKLVIYPVLEGLQVACPRLTVQATTITLNGTEARTGALNSYHDGGVNSLQENTDGQ